MLLNEFLSRCRNVKQVNDNQYCCDCPCCGDTKRHLYVSCSDTNILLDCKKGCNWLDILKAFGLTKKDLYFNSNNNRWEFLRSHEYCDITGKKLAIKEIYKKLDNSKTAIWKHYNNNGVLEKGLGGLKLPLYRINVISNMDNDDVLFLVEGEKDVDTLTRLCFYATTSPNGAGSHWSSKRFNQHLQNKDIIIISDNDDVGIKYANEVAKCVFDVAKSVKLVNATAFCPDLKNKGDISDVVEILGDSRTIELLDSVIKSDYYTYTKEPNPEEHNPNNIPKWFDELKFSPKGFILPTLHNVVTILKYDENYSNKIMYNELKTERELNYQSWTDKIESKLKLYLEEVYDVCVSIETLNHACNNIEKSYHPIKDYLNVLVWDNIPRLETLFIDFLGAKDNPYTRKVAIITLLGAVARVYNPGCKFDTCTTLVGRQGVGKSKFIRKLAINPDWFTDSVSTFEGKEFVESIQGKWLVELGEGTAFQKSIKERTKQVITQQEEFYRKPYARNPEVRKRQCVFLGTTNNYDFLKDETGDRRFYPIDVDIRKATKSIEKDLTTEYINQLWAETLYRYNQKEQIYITDENILSIATAEQMSHFDESPLQSDIFNFLEILLPNPQEWYSWDLDRRRRYIRAYQDGEDVSKTLKVSATYRRDRVSVKEIMCELFGYELNQPIERKMSLDVSRCLKSLRWEKSNKAERISPYGVVKVFIHE